MNIFRLVLCLAGILTYLILKEVVTSPPPAGVSNTVLQPEPLFKPLEPSSTEVLSSSNPLWAKDNTASSPLPVTPAKTSSVDFSIKDCLESESELYQFTNATDRHPSLKEMSRVDFKLRQDARLK